MKKILFLLIVLISVSCSKTEQNLTIKGKIKGLKKGKVYLSKVLDSTFLVLDSTVINGDSNFKLTGNIEEPEVLFLSLDANSGIDNYISFFADKGETTINTTLKRFAYDFEIIGCEQQAIYDKYRIGAKSFNDSRLDLIKLQYEAINDGDRKKSDSIINIAGKNIKRKYFYTINFALNHKDSEVAPYLALSEIYDAKLNYLDTIYGALPENIAQSKYGKSLREYIKERKELE